MWIVDKEVNMKAIFDSMFSLTEWIYENHIVMWIVDKEVNMKAIFAVMITTWAVVKIISTVI